jgi:hypothetical protein
VVLTGKATLDSLIRGNAGGGLRQLTRALRMAELELKAVYSFGTFKGRSWPERGNPGMVSGPAPTRHTDRCGLNVTAIICIVLGGFALRTSLYPDAHPHF